MNKNSSSDINVKVNKDTNMDGKANENVNSNVYANTCRSMNSELAGILDEIKLKKPLVHHMTNYVTVNDCANIVLALGASPIMADDIDEVEDIVSISSALVLNIGTLNKRTIDSMLAAGKKANELGIPVILDPVGVGATPLRNSSAEKIINEVKLAVVRGNMSEIKFLGGLGAATRGVDASEQDMLEAGDLQYSRSIAEKLSRRLGCVIVITGVVDVITDGSITCFVENGHKMLSQVTGTGCMCTSLIGACCGASKNYFQAAAAGVAFMGMAGETAYDRLDLGFEGSGSFKVKLIDAIGSLNPAIIGERGKVYER